MQDRETREQIEQAARDWLVRIQLGDTSGPGETAGQRMETLAAFEVWREVDPAHAAAYAALLQSVRHTDGLAGGALIAESRLSRAAFARRHPWLSSAIAACVVAAAGFTLHALDDRMPQANMQSRGGVAMASLDVAKETGVGESRRIDLPDGSVVLLDTDSALHIRFSAGERRLRLDRGRARFTVAHDLARPFIVEAGDSMVIAHGTVFDVAVGRRGIHVALLRGAVEVRSGLSAHPALEGGSVTQVRQLAPGQAISLAPAEPMPLPQAVSSEELGWPSGRLGFRDTPLVEAVEEINRYNARKIVLGQDLDGTLKISGGFDAREPKAFADSVAALLHLRVDARPDGQIALHRAASGGSRK